MRSLASRQRRSKIMTGAMVAAVLLAIVPLCLILADVIAKGLSELSLGFLTQQEPFVQTAAGGGFGAGVRGTIKMVALGTLIALPIGILASLYLTEYKARSVLASRVRLFADLMTCIPSIIVRI